MEAIILAGGFGTRLAKVVPDLPKPMAPVAGRPFLVYLLSALKHQGFRHFILSVGYRAERIMSVIGESFDGVPVSYAVEQTPLGTGGAIQASLTFAGEGSVFVFNGDTFADVDCAAMLQQHAANKEHLSVALTHVPDTARYGAVVVRDGHIHAFAEKGAAGPGMINSGVYLLQSDIFADRQPNIKFSFETEILQAQLERLRPAAFPSGDFFIDIGVPEDYARAQTELSLLACLNSEPAAPANS